MPSLVAVAVVLVGLVAYLVLVAVGVIADFEDGVPRCRVTPAGEEYRRHQAVEQDQRPEGVAGDTYTSGSGCVPGDDRLD